MATMDPTVTPESVSGTVPAVKVGNAFDKEPVNGTAGETEARADVEVEEIGSYVSPTGGADSHIGSISDRSGEVGGSMGGI